MWVGLDWFGRLLIDTTLATAVFLSLVILLMLLCQQPARRHPAGPGGHSSGSFDVPADGCQALRMVKGTLVADRA